jgi:diguanylate cyclase (GGDEF)-like protein/PAS domain S-box-containing protein
MSTRSDKLKIEEARAGYIGGRQDGIEEALFPLAHVDGGLNYIRVNRAYAGNFGYEPEEMAGMGLRDTVSPEDRERFEQSLRELTRSGRSEGAVRALRRDGSSFHQQFILSRNAPGIGQEDDYRCLMINITEKRQREKLWRLEQNILRRIAVNDKAEDILEELCLEVEAVLEDAICLVSLLDGGSRTVVANIAPGLPGDLLNAGDAMPWLREAAAGGAPIITEDVMQSPLWEGYWDLAGRGIGSFFSHPLFSQDGSVKGAVCIARGRTGPPTNLDREMLKVAGSLAGIALDNSRSQELLRRYKEMVSSSRDMMAYVDRDYIHKAVSISYAGFYRLNRDEVIGRSVPDIIGTELFNDLIKARLDKAFQGESGIWTSWRQMDDGEPHHLTTHYDPILENDAVVGVVLVSRDTTETHLTEQALRESEERFNLAMRGLNDGLWDWDPATDAMYYSPTWGKMLGYTDETYVGTREDFHELVHEEDRQHVIVTMQNFAAGVEDRFEIEFRLRHRDGHYLDIQSRGFGLRDDHSGKITRVIGVNADITDRKETETRLQESERRFRALYDDSPTMFFTLDMDGGIRSINRFGAGHLGFTVAELVGTNICEHVHADDRKMLRKQLAGCAQGGNRGLPRCEFRIYHKFSDMLWVRATLRMITRDGDSDSEILVSCEDITEARILSEQLEYQAQHDSLTGLINRGEFERRLRRVLNSQSAGNEHALCYLDLDQFKIINDSCGHLAGDELLRRVSYMLNRVVRKRDTLARLGGDEFAMLLEHCPLEQAKRVATEILDSVCTLRFSWEGKRFTPGVTIGLVPINEHSGTVTDVLSAADAACYAAKDAGRNRVHVYHPDDSELSKRRSEMHWVSEINRALEENRLCLAAQPIASVAGTGSGRKGKHYEVLIRMRDEAGKVIYPGSFLPAAERYNLSVRLDRWVVSAVIAWLQENPEQLASLALCAINLSGHTLGDTDFLDFLLEKFQAEGIAADKFCFEVTETAAVANLGAAIEFITALKSIGCSFALDDFGSGLSSFNYLKNLPVDYLKIDGSFIREITHDPIDRAMVQSINDIGHVMGMETIAEFVEDEGILQVLQQIGVDYVQGFAIGRPEMLDPGAPDKARMDLSGM